MASGERVGAAGRLAGMAGYRNELAVLAILLLASFLLPGAASIGSSIGALASGGVLVFHTIAIVLVYRTNRFLNFAQLQFSAFAATIFAGLVNGKPLLRLFSADGTTSDVAAGLNFAIAVVVTLAIAIFGSALIYQTLIRRFANAPRIMPTLVSIFLAQALQNINPSILGWLQQLPTKDNLGQGIPNGPAAGPLDFSWTIGGLPLRFADLLIIVLAPLVAIAIATYLRRSKAGTAMRAAAEDPQRAATLGLDVFGVTSRAWMITGALAGVAGILYAFTAGAPVSVGLAVTTLPVGMLVLILTIAVLARFSSLPLVAAGSYVIAILRGDVQRTFGSLAPFEATLIVLVAGLLLLQRRKRVTARDEAEQNALHDVAREPHPIPPELRNVPVVQRWIRTTITLTVLAALGLPWALNAGQVSLAGGFIAASVAGLSLLILTGWGGQISLGQWGFAAIGAWVTAVSGLPLPVALPLAAVVGAGAALLVGFPALKLRGLQLAIATLAFAWSASYLLFQERYLGRFLPTETGNTRFLGIDLSSSRTGYYAAMVFCGLFVLATIGLRRSRFGRALIAVRTNEKAAEAFGIDPRRLRLTAFAIAGAYAAMAGSMVTLMRGAAPPEAFVADESLRVFMFTVIGGLGGVAGPIVGFAFLALLSFLPTSPIIAFIGAGVGGLGLLISAPGGLAEVGYRVRDAALRRLAIRNRIPAASLLGDRAARHLREHALLREHPAGRDPVLPPVRYELPGQWALERYGLEGAATERVGAGGGRGAR